MLGVIVVVDVAGENRALIQALRMEPLLEELIIEDADYQVTRFKKRLRIGNGIYPFCFYTQSVQVLIGRPPRSRNRRGGQSGVRKG